MWVSTRSSIQVRTPGFRTTGYSQEGALAGQTSQCLPYHTTAERTEVPRELVSCLEQDLVSVEGPGADPSSPVVQRSPFLLVILALGPGVLLSNPAV